MISEEAQSRQEWNKGHMSTSDLLVLWDLEQGISSCRQIVAELPNWTEHKHELQVPQ